ncbi:hypothetical protein PVAP13_8KG266700 [Panicum virgatum]|uniref:Uncharacterized protein n=1 Tax=Panicum virgatum TaxID=38727 RepID=A0A8T0PPA8_PANVG|nr:hypothetical protein PVAP13_8KG266700 [Panicum virgatum]
MGAYLGMQGCKAAAGIGQSAAAVRVAGRRHGSAAGRLGGAGTRRRKGGEQATVRRCRAARRRLQVRPPVQRCQQLRSPPITWCCFLTSPGMDNINPKNTRTSSPARRDGLLDVPQRRVPPHLRPLLSIRIISMHKTRK